MLSLNIPSAYEAQVAELSAEAERLKAADAAGLLLISEKEEAIPGKFGQV